MTLVETICEQCLKKQGKDLNNHYEEMVLPSDSALDFSNDFEKKNILCKCKFCEKIWRLGESSGGKMK